MEGACALGLGAAAPQAMVGAKAAGHHGVPETNPSLETSSKKLSSGRSTVQFYVRRRKKKGRFRTRVKLVGRNSGACKQGLKWYRTTYGSSSECGGKGVIEFLRNLTFLLSTVEHAA